MKNLRTSLTVEQIQNHWVVVDRQMWEAEKPDTLLTLMGSRRLAAGPFSTEQEAQTWHDRLAAG